MHFANAIVLLSLSELGVQYDIMHRTFT